MTTPQNNHHILLNGQFVSPQHSLPPGRALLYGDGIFESMRGWEGKIPLFDLHWARWQKGNEALGLKAEWDKEDLHNQLLELLKTNRCAGNARLRLGAWREEGGFYKPEAAEAHWQAECWPMEQTRLFDDTQQPLRLLVYRQALLPRKGFPHIKHMGRFLHVQAARAAVDCGDALLLNDAGRPVCTTAGNIFVYREGVFFTPPTTEGCLAGVMREAVLRAHTLSGIAVAVSPITLDEFENAEFALTTNAVKGLSWVPIGQTEAPVGQVSSILQAISRQWRAL